MLIWTPKSAVQISEELAVLTHFQLRVNTELTPCWEIFESIIKNCAAI